MPVAQERMWLKTMTCDACGTKEEQIIRESTINPGEVIKWDRPWITFDIVFDLGTQVNPERNLVCSEACFHAICEKRWKNRTA